MQHGVWLTAGESADVGRLVELGVEAERAGWDGVFVSDSLPFAEFPDPWVTLAGIAARTEDVTLGTWVVPVPRRQPWQLAMEVATLDRLSDGRVLLGAGLGNDDEYDAFGTPYEPRRLGARLDETLEIVTDLWTGEPVSYDGDHFSLDDAEVLPTPAQEPRVPVLAGGWWPNKEPFRRGARWDGIMPYWPSLTGDGVGPRGEEATGLPVEEVRDSLAYYHDVADEPGDVVLPTIESVDPDEYHDVCEAYGVTWSLTTDLAESDDGALERVRAGPQR